MKGDFNCIDVETANSSPASICQIGLVLVRSAEVFDTWQSLVNPAARFSAGNIAVHGITADDVCEGPRLPAVWDGLRELTQGVPLVCHSWFDRNALTRAAEQHGLPQLSVEWVDSSSIVRQTWPDRYGKRGYGLANLSIDFNIRFRHHDALEDARAAALVTLEALDASGLTILEWCQELSGKSGSSGSKERRSSKISRQTVARQGKTDGQFAGQAVVFTGRLSVSRTEAARLAALSGCDVHDNVKAGTTILVVGDYAKDNRTMMKGASKSSKQVKAEKLIAAGQQIAILTESEFWGLVESTR